MSYYQVCGTIWSRAAVLLCFLAGECDWQRLCVSHFESHFFIPHEGHVPTLGVWMSSTHTHLHELISPKAAQTWRLFSFFVCFKQKTWFLFTRVGGSRAELNGPLCFLSGFFFSPSIGNRNPSFILVENLPCSVYLCLSMDTSPHAKCVWCAYGRRGLCYSLHHCLCLPPTPSSLWPAAATFTFIGQKQTEEPHTWLWGLPFFFFFLNQPQPNTHVSSFHSALTSPHPTSPAPAE